MDIDDEDEKTPSLNNAEGERFGEEEAAGGSSGGVEGMEDTEHGLGNGAWPLPMAGATRKGGARVLKGRHIEAT